MYPISGWAMLPVGVGLVVEMADALMTAIATLPAP